eukprot:gnl/TRDRNA2_/TRDRNA2_73849_c0_seq1.p1 gnl/TRDRNA2_/TRDRNA2_73849_c0~~gnl/TRDRNA2_/TRDRNA2_73849_c0_seq1.p1  ORF type:complete len:533 (+),score=45.72 gnl/TRDRNA2_/TRDRNA2_73849_c0_seq1:69-1601(+)
MLSVLSSRDGMVRPPTPPRIYHQHPAEEARSSLSSADLNRALRQLANEAIEGKGSHKVEADDSRHESREVSRQTSTTSSTGRRAYDAIEAWVPQIHIGSHQNAKKLESERDTAAQGYFSHSDRSSSLLALPKQVERAQCWAPDSRPSYENAMEDDHVARRKVERVNPYARNGPRRTWQPSGGPEHEQSSTRSRSKDSAPQEVRKGSKGSTGSLSPRDESSQPHVRNRNPSQYSPALSGLMLPRPSGLSNPLQKSRNSRQTAPSGGSSRSVPPPARSSRKSFEGDDHEGGSLSELHGLAGLLQVLPSAGDAGTGSSTSGRHSAAARNSTSTSAAASSASSSCGSRPSSKPLSGWATSLWQRGGQLAAMRQFGSSAATSHEPDEEEDEVFVRRLLERDQSTDPERRPADNLTSSSGRATNCPSGEPPDLQVLCADLERTSYTIAQDGGTGCSPAKSKDQIVRRKPRLDRQSQRASLDSARPSASPQSQQQRGGALANVRRSLTGTLQRIFTV